MGINYTDEQKKVIYLRDENILVSAAAGSGKTAVLVERIIQLICDEDRPVDIDRLLIVTFTNAAAAEMRERIGNAITKKLASEPENEHLQRQSALIHNACITTIDSFCLFVIRNYFQEIDMDPSFRIADEGEVSLIMQEALAEILEEAFAEGDKDFFKLVECYSTGKKETALEEAIKSLHRFAMSNPWPEKWLWEHDKDYDIESFEQFEQSELWEYGKTYLQSMFPEFYRQMKECRRICEEPDGPAVYGEVIDATLEQIERLCKASGYEEMRECLERVTFERLPGAKKSEFNELKIESVKNIRNDLKKSIEKIKSDFFSYTEEGMLRQCREIAPVIKCLIKLTLRFMECFQEKKKDKNLIDFSDMEHLALQILCKEEDGKICPTAAALQLRDYFAEIMIDEYQDSNYVQECILQCISSEENGHFNRFMVGDVKQSIYKFRLARPELFMEKFASYSTKEGPYRRIDLNQNFRSRTEVIDSVNVLFEQLMAKDLGKIDYDDASKLYKGADYPERECNAEVLLISNEESEEKAAMQEAKALASRIKRLMREELVTDKETKQLRPARYEDIVILLRSGNGYDETIKQELDCQEIPCFINSKTGYFQTKEISTILQLLRILNNPLQDIPFYGVLKSYFGGFTEIEIARIAVAGTEETNGNKRKRYLYQKLQDYLLDGEENLQNKIATFLAWYKDLRSMMTYMSISELLEVIIRKSGYLLQVLASPNGQQKYANVQMLLQKASDFEKTSFKGLNHFIHYIDQIQKYNIDYGEAGILGENANVVRIMTIHKSKGLEFPICILAGTSKKMNKKDASASVLTDVDMGIAVDYVNPDIRIKQKTLRKNIMASKILLDAQAEELRVLYVALTRAKEKLIITGVLKNVTQIMSKYQQMLKYDDKVLPYNMRAQASSYMDLLMPALMRLEKMQPLLEEYGFEKARYIIPSNMKIEVFSEPCILEEEVKQNENAIYNALTFKNDLINTVIDESVQDNLQKKFGFTYPYEYLKQLYVKTSVSELKMAKMMQLENEGAHSIFKEEEIVPYLPSFLKEEEKISGATRGSAMHRLMELIDFSKEYDMQTLQEFVEARVADGKLRKEYAEAIRPEKVIHFLNTGLAKRMKAAKERNELYLEQPFVLGIAANTINEELPEDEQVLIQGIIDVFFVEDDKIILLDYKTDVIDHGGQLEERYRTQLLYYKEALERITGKTVAETLLYSFYLEKEIAVKSL